MNRGKDVYGFFVLPFLPFSFLPVLIRLLALVEPQPAPDFSPLTAASPLLSIGYTEFVQQGPLQKLGKIEPAGDGGILEIRELDSIRKVLRKVKNSRIGTKHGLSPFLDIMARELSIFYYRFF
ncbi:MAG TPA: hypothetical protein DHV71_00980 [Acidaminococcaceae bacterium]|jgi:hypothetical protein|nr:hypothetical protein [Acidaminococcaceae bacterium]